MLLDCGIGNRLFTVDSQSHLPLEWTRWAHEPPFSTLFTVRAGAPFAIEDRVINRTLQHFGHHTLLGTLRSAPRNFSKNFICCMCSDMMCGPAWRYLAPPPPLVQPLAALRARLPPNATTFHWRDSEERTKWGAHPWRFSTHQMEAILRHHKPDYVATQRAEDAAWLREHHPHILLQEDVRPPHWGFSLGSFDPQAKPGVQDATDSLLAAVFDMFALSLGTRILHSSLGSTFARAGLCLRDGNRSFHGLPLLAQSGDGSVRISPHPRPNATMLLAETEQLLAEASARLAAGDAAGALRLYERVSDASASGRDTADDEPSSSLMGTGRRRRL